VNLNPQTENQMNMKRATAVVLAALLLPGVAMAQIDTRATFKVNKVFADGNNVDEVVISLDCTSGQILDQDKVLGNGDAVEFIVTAFTDNTPNCFIVEGDVTDGYAASYSGDGVGEGNTGDCAWDAIDDDTTYNCTVTNTPKAVDIKVTKDWVIEGDNNDVNLNYTVGLNCSSGQIQGNTYGTGEGPASKVFTFKVVPAFPSTSCYAWEDSYDSAIDVTNGCNSLSVSAGNGTACKITNTVFFEGIPTLSQYGMAIMALLMLGVGFVGFRRFV
jgi:hypothetical protein